MENEFKPASFRTLMRNIGNAAQLLNEDFEHFTSLERVQQTELFLKIKRLKPAPEFKEDYEFLITQMKEEMAFADNPGGDPPTATAKDKAAAKAETSDEAAVPPTVITEPELKDEDEVPPAVMEDVQRQVLNMVRLELAKIASLTKVNNYQAGRRVAFKAILKFIESAD